MAEICPIRRKSLLNQSFDDFAFYVWVLFWRKGPWGMMGRGWKERGTRGRSFMKCYNIQNIDCYCIYLVHHGPVTNMSFSDSESQVTLKARGPDSTGHNILQYYFHFECTSLPALSNGALWYWKMKKIFWPKFLTTTGHNPSSVIYCYMYMCWRPLSSVVPRPLTFFPSELLGQS